MNVLTFKFKFDVDPGIIKGATFEFVLRDPDGFEDLATNKIHSKRWITDIMGNGNYIESGGKFPCSRGIDPATGNHQPINCILQIGENAQGWGQTLK